MISWDYTTQYIGSSWQPVQHEWQQCDNRISTPGGYRDMSARGGAAVYGQWHNWNRYYFSVWTHLMQILCDLEDLCTGRLVIFSDFLRTLWQFLWTRKAMDLRSTWPPFFMEDPLWDDFTKFAHFLVGERHQPGDGPADTVDGCEIRVSPVDRWFIPWFCWGFNHPFGGAGFRWPIHRTSGIIFGMWWKKPFLREMSISFDYKWL